MVWHSGEISGERIVWRRQDISDHHLRVGTYLTAVAQSAFGAIDIDHHRCVCHGLFTLNCYAKSPHSLCYQITGEYRDLEFRLYLF